VDAGGDVIVAGTTTSNTFPTTSTAFQTAPVSGGNHVFVSKLDTTLHTLLYSTYLSGNGADIASGLALDPGGNAYVTGTTASTEVATGFPSMTGALQTEPAAGSLIQFFISRIDPSLSGSSSVVYSTYFGPGNPAGVAGLAVGGGIAVDSNSNAYITGGTNFTGVWNFTTFALNAYQGTVKGGLDAFVVKINPNLHVAQGAQLLYSTYFGGSGDDVGYGIAVDPPPNASPSAYITGSTTSPATDFVFPTGITPFQATNGGGTDAFLAKFGTPCTGMSCTTTDLPLNYLTYLGGTGTDIGTAIAVDSLQGARLTGWTNSASDFHTTANALQGTYGGPTSDAFVARIDTLSTSHYSSYFGGAAADTATSIAIDSQGASYLTGETFSSTGFPLASAYQGALKGTSDAFVSKLGPTLSMTMAATGTPLITGVGGQVSFKYTITNNGDFTNNIIFTDTLPASGATFVSATASPGTCGAASGGTVLCSIGTLNAAATATVTIILTPVAPTIPGGSVTLGNSAVVGVGGSTLANANASVKVNDFSLGVAPASATVPAGVPATFTATLTPSANDGFPGSVSLTCGSGLPTGATCLPGNNNPIPNLNTGPQSAQLIFNTTARVTTTTDLRHEGSGVPLYAAWLPVSGLALLGVGLGGKRSRTRRALTGLLLAGFFGLALFQAGCGSSKHTTTTTGTPAGTYPVTINATSGTNATRSTVVTLVVE
jgi:hypothetical protein